MRWLLPALARGSACWPNASTGFLLRLSACRSERVHGRHLGATATRIISWSMLLLPDPALLERAWAAALPGREAAERNAVLRALVAMALERPPRPVPVLPLMVAAELCCRHGRRITQDQARAASEARPQSAHYGVEHSWL
jgi:hypothetical protein